MPAAQRLPRASINDRSSSTLGFRTLTYCHFLAALLPSVALHVSIRSWLREHLRRELERQGSLPSTKGSSQPRKI
ncbi:KR domain-containing protein [Colletotrichum scovillei]|uniref:KR domain-containing protein n=1 Tax=Colletotrichum scovillei TaxID=1209932 RepID=A0A9P7U3A3_9PEZI|nr:KR domain-containing protein [Colletotrichum scovillei]KAG7040481.1 KR domain-containing protein [Colletotrichum scovillei]KAG7060529.1 KR domain-containing protein [Colletotrichum scovillei]